MVRRGEYLERAVVIPGAPPLEGLYHRGTRRSAALVAPPHPERGGGMEGPVVAELAWALTRAGHATLRFGYPGVGASGGRFDLAGAAEARDRAAEHLARSVDPLRPVAVHAVGLGFGGGLLLEGARGRPDVYASVVWVRPDPDEPLPELEGFDGSLAVVLPGRADPGWRRAVQAWADRAPRAAVRSVPGADPAFLQGLVTLGQVVVELLDPPGLVDLG